MNQIKNACDLEAKFWLVLRLKIVFYILPRIGEYEKSDLQGKEKAKKDLPSYLLEAALSDLVWFNGQQAQIILVKLVTRLTYKSIIFLPIVSRFSSYSIKYWQSGSITVFLMDFCLFEIHSPTSLKKTLYSWKGTCTYYEVFVWLRCRHSTGVIYQVWCSKTSSWFQMN